MRRKEGILLAFIGISLLLSISPATGLTFSKHYDEATKTFWLEVFGEKVFEAQLIENTDQCLVNCHAIIRLRSSVDLQVPDLPDELYDWRFSSQLKKYWFEILENETYNYTVPIYGNCSKEVWNNETNSSEVVNYTCIVDYENKTGVREVWKPFKFFGYYFEAGRDYYIKLRGVKNPRQNVEWIPRFQGFDVVEWAWWNSSWSYKRQINITEQSGNSLTNYQVMLSINTTELYNEGKIRSDCGDIRFVDSTETIELPYWIEVCDVTGGNSTIWVKVNLSASSTTTIYMYYGNSDATTTANGTAVFDFFDDFEGISLDTSKWTQTGGTAQVSNSILSFTSGEAGTWYKIYSNTEFTYPNILKSLFKIDDANPGTAGHGKHLGFEDASTDDKAVFVWHSGDGAYKTQTTNGESNNEQTLSVSLADWSVGEIFWNTSYTEFWVNGTPRNNHTAVSTLPDEPISVLFTTAGDGYIYVDWVLVRQYANPEPTYSIGSEEIRNLPPEINFTSPSNTTYYTLAIPINVSITDDSSTEFYVKIQADGTTIYENSSYENGTLISMTHNFTSGGQHYIYVFANDTDATSPKTSEETVYFYIFMGLNASAYWAADNSELASWGIKVENDTTSFVNTSCSNPCYVSFEECSGICTITFFKEGYVNETTTATITSDSIVTKQGYLWHYDYFRAQDSISGTYKDFSITFSNGSETLSYNSTNTWLNISHEVMLRGDITARVKIYGYADNVTSWSSVVDTTNLSMTFSIDPVNLTIRCYDERNLTQINFSVDITNGTSSLSMSNISEFTDYVSNLPSGEVQILISDPTNQRVQRKYFLPILGNESINLSAYLLSASAGSTFTFYVKLTATNEFVSGARIKAKKSINATWVTIQEEETDNSGTAIFFLDPTTIYQFEIDYQGNKTYYNTYPKNDYTFWIGNPLSVASNYYHVAGSVYGSCEFNESTKLLSCSFVDVEGEVVKVWFRVERGEVSRTEVCSGYKETNTYTFKCNLSSYSVGTFYYSLIGEKNGIRKLMDSGRINLGFPEGPFGDLPSTQKLLLGFMLTLFLIFTGIFSPAAALIMSGIGFAASYALGLVEIQYATLVALLIGVGITIFKGRE